MELVGDIGRFHSRGKAYYSVLCMSLLDRGAVYVPQLN